MQRILGMRNELLEEAAEVGTMVTFKRQLDGELDRKGLEG